MLSLRVALCAMGRTHLFGPSWAAWAVAILEQLRFPVRKATAGKLTVGLVVPDRENLQVDLKAIRDLVVSG